ncbi:hypothetical protein PG988_015902 [Apiospora saccharicola]
MSRASTHKSLFDYNLSRPYPFRWFTPLAVVGVILLTTIFSFINYATGAFYLGTEYTSRPAELLRNEHRDKFFTSNFGFAYTLKSINNGSDGSFPSISLSHERATLQDCNTTNVNILLQRSTHQRVTHHASSWEASELRTTVTCRVHDELDNPSILQMNHQLTYVEIIGQLYIIKHDPHYNASVWWGMQRHWMTTPFGSGETYIMDGKRIKPGKYSLRKPAKNIANGNSIYADDFFSLDYFLKPNFWPKRLPPTNPNQTTTERNGPVVYNNPDLGYAAAFLEGHQLAKVMHSLVSVDLGKSATPNHLLDDEALRRLLHGTDDRNRWPGGNLTHAALDKAKATDEEMSIRIMPPVHALGEKGIPFAESYGEIAGQDRTGKLRTEPATIYTEYACTVLRPKSTWVVLWTVLVADIVVLRAAWAVLNWVTGRLVKQHDPEAMFCAGCAAGAY